MENWFKNKRIENKKTRTKLAKELKIDVRTYTRKEDNLTFSINEAKHLINYYGYEMQVIKKGSIIEL